jgi:hypothetical protein
MYVCKTIVLEQNPEPQNLHEGTEELQIYMQTEETTSCALPNHAKNKQPHNVSYFALNQ